MKKRTFNAEFKTKVVLEAIRGEKEINQLAIEHEIAPNLIRNWKEEFLTNATIIFDSKRDAQMLESLRKSESEKDDLVPKVGQLIMQVDWLKKNLKNLLDLTGRVNLVKSLMASRELPIKDAAELLGINRTSVYYKGLLNSHYRLVFKVHCRLGNR